MSASRQVNQAIARFDEVMGRIDAKAATRPLRELPAARGRAAVILKVTAIAMVLAVIMIGIAVAGLFGAISSVGLYGAIGIAVAAAAIFLLWPGEKPLVAFKDDMPNGAVVRRLSNLLSQKRTLLPIRAGQKVDAISKQLPMLESRLADADILDPIAQDARRLMGRHLPELIERYERVPPAFRAERDGEGLTVDDRLVQGLDAAQTALDDLGRKLVREDMDAFQTQGRFIESRYREENGPLQGS